jgi:hypothetical protein
MRPLLLPAAQALAIDPGVALAPSCLLHAGCLLQDLHAKAAHLLAKARPSFLGPAQQVGAGVGRALASGQGRVARAWARLGSAPGDHVSRRPLPPQSSVWFGAPSASAERSRRPGALQVPPPGLEGVSAADLLGALQPLMPAWRRLVDTASACLREPPEDGANALLEGGREGRASAWRLAGMHWQGMRQL